MAIITPGEISALCRPISTDEEVALSLIAEAEREDIVPRIGGSVYARILNRKPDAREDDALGILLNGGQWETSSGEVRFLAGLKVAHAYLAYARIVRDGNILPTRYGARVKSEENSSEAVNAERQRQYRQVFASGDAYLIECLEYINANCAALGVPRVGALKSNRTRFRVIDSGRGCGPIFTGVAPKVATTTFNDDFNEDFDK